jgi:hypothetical protein
LDQAVGKTLSIPWRIKLDSELFSLRHLPEVNQIGANDRYTISARQVRDAAASRGRRVGHDRDGGALKQIGQRVFRNVSAELDSRIPGALLLNGFGVASSLRMISTGDHKLSVR